MFDEIKHGQLESQQRNSSVELLRIVAIAGVIILHFNMMCWSRVWDTFLNKAVLFTCQHIFICAVDLFIMITGYYMCDRVKVSLKKPFELIVQLIVVGIAAHIIFIFIGRAQLTAEGIVLLLVPRDYFVVLYSALYLLLPYINRAINFDNNDGLRKLTVLLFIVFSVWNFSVDIISKIIGVSMEAGTTVSRFGSGEGCTMVNFALCYIIGAAIRKKAVSIKRPLICFVVCLFLGLIISWYDLVLGDSYHNPLIILQAASVLMMAEKFSFYSKTINKISKMVFMVYLTHNYVLVNIFNGIYVEGSIFIMLGYMMLLIAIAFSVGFLAYYLYQLSFGLVLKKLGHKLDKVEISAV